MRVNLADHERHLGVLAPGRGVVDDDGPGCGETRGVLARGRAPGGEDGDVDTRQVRGGDVLDLDLGTAEVHDGPGAAGRGEEAHRAGGEVALGQHGAHDAANLAGGPHDGDADAVGHSGVGVHGIAHRPVPP